MASEPSRSRQDSDWDVRNPFRQFKLTSYLKEELLQSVRKHQEQAGSEDRGPFNNRMYTFLTVPQYLESFMCYGLLQCLDQLLLIYTLLPLRCLLVVWRLFLHPLRHVTSSLVGLLALLQPRSPEQLVGGGDGGDSGLLLYSHELRDICRLAFIAICSGMLAKFDTSVAYHEIRTQSVVKIYIFFNLLEVADRLLSSVGQDALDDLFHTVSETLQTYCDHPSAKMSDKHKEMPRCSSEPKEEEAFGNEGDVGSGSSAEHGNATPLVLARDLFFQFGFALICLFSHCFLLMCQVTTLNVAFNSVNKSLVTVFISNNFVELKGNVFRKMGKTNLFQIACADVRERFHYFVWLFIVVSRNMTDTGWNLDELWEMLFDVVCIFLAEVAVDWVKHAFITKFNVIPSDVYREYTVSLAFDLLLCRQGNNTSDYFDLLSRRMGLTPIPLSCLINVMLLQTVRTSSPFFLYCTLPSIILGLFTLKVLVNVCLLSTAYSHVKAYIKMTQAANQQHEPTSDNFAVPCAPLVVTSTNDLQHGEQHAGKQQRQREEVTTPAVDNVAGQQQLTRYELPLSRDEQSFWSPTMVLRHRRVRMHSETSSARCRTPSPLHQLSSEPCDGGLGGADLWSSGCLLDRSPNWSTQLEGHEMAAAAVDEAVAPNSSPELGNSVGLAFYNNTTPSDNNSQLLLLLNDTEPVGPQQLPASTAPETPLLSSSLRVEDTGASDDEDDALLAATTAGQHQQVMVGRRPETTGLRRSFSIDMGVLSALSRQLTHTDAQRRRAEEEALGYPMIVTTADDHQHAVSRRRSRRSRTNTYCSGGGLPASLRAVRWEEDVLPVLWEKSSRNSVIQPSPGLEMAATQNRSPLSPDGETLVPQPLPNIDRYSMLEGQIS